MVEFESLVDSCQEGAFVCSNWELRVTRRCLEDDLRRSRDSQFVDLQDIEIIQALIRDRSTRTNDTRQVAPLTCGQEIWVLSHGSDHRGGTFHDEDEQVVWLVCARHHRSGQLDDFFPYCKAIDAEDRLLPTEDDYERMFRERDRRYVAAIVVEAPFVLERAREAAGEIDTRIANDSIAIAIEAADDLEEIAVAFDTRTTAFDHVPIILTALRPGDWDVASKMPSRALKPFEYAYTFLGER